MTTQTPTTAANSNQPNIQHQQPFNPSFFPFSRNHF
jgi:hypothetical protein